MKSQATLYLIIALLSGLNGYLIIERPESGQKPAPSDNVEHRLELMRYNYIQTISNSQLNNNYKLRSDIVLMDSLGKIAKLVDLTKTGTKLIVRSTETGCSICIENELKVIKKLVSKIGASNIIVITNHDSIRKLNVFRETNNLNLNLYICKSIGLPYESASSKPYVFTVGPNSVVQNFFIPELTEPNASQTYYSTIQKLYFL